MKMNYHTCKNYTHSTISYIYTNTIRDIGSKILVLGCIRIIYVWIQVFNLISSIVPASERAIFAASFLIQHESSSNIYKRIPMILGCYLFNFNINDDENQINICHNFHKSRIYNAAITASLHTAVIISIDLLIAHACCAILMTFCKVFVCRKYHDDDLTNIS